MKKNIWLLLMVSLLVAFSGCGEKVEDAQPLPNGSVEERSSAIDNYAVYYGVLTNEAINVLKQYDLVIVHPRIGNVTRGQVKELQDNGCIVLGYISIGEDLRTYGLSADEMLLDLRFIGDRTGPRVDPRKEGDKTLDDVAVRGVSSSFGTGYASYYLDDNDHDGKPDMNVYFGCAFTNIGDPEWYKVLQDMLFDSSDKVPGIREILTLDYGRGLGCDGLFLDTIDTAAPNAYTSDSQPNKTRYEWTAPGVLEFCKQLKADYPDKFVLQNRGMFMFNSEYPAFAYNTRAYIDYLMVESYRLDSNKDILFYDTYFLDNKYNYVPKIMAEANRTDGFTVLSLGYAEGPAEYMLKETLLGQSNVGTECLMTDIYEAQDVAGFKHYITDSALELFNDYVLKHADKTDTTAPVWNSVYNNSKVWPSVSAEPRVGIQQITSENGTLTIHYDVALDKNKVIYQLYYQDKAFDFEKDPALKEASCIQLDPLPGKGYTHVGRDIYANQSIIEGFETGKEYWFLLRAKDIVGNEEDNQVVFKVTVK